MKNRKGLKALLILLAIVTAGVIFSCSANSRPAKDNAVVIKESETAEPGSPAEALSGEQTEKTICIHICGSVKAPGVYYLKEGARLHEAVDRAGGLTEDAAPEYVNLAGIITDGEQIYIPDKKETEDGSFRLQASGTTESGLVNLNTASEEDLMTLPGIGQTKAKAIIAYRESSGGFSNIEELMNVSGIAESSYEKIKDYIRV